MFRGENLVRGSKESFTTYRIATFKKFLSTSELSEAFGVTKSFPIVL